MCRSDHSGLEALAPVLLSSRLGLGCGSAALGRLWGWVCKFSQGSLLLNSFQFSRNTWFPGEHHIRISELGWTLTSLTTSSSPHLNRRRVYAGQPQLHLESPCPPTSPSCLSFSPDGIMWDAAQGGESSCHFTRIVHFWLRLGCGFLRSMLPGHPASFLSE